MTDVIKNQYGQSRFTGFFHSKSVSILSALVLLLLVILLMLGDKEAVVIQFDEQSCLLEGRTFELKWIHSVEKQWWIEAYELKEGAFLLTDTYFETFGAGSPSMSASDMADKSNQTQTDDYESRQKYLNEQYSGYVHYEVNQTLPHLNWMVSSNVNAVIINQKHTVPIYQWVNDYTNIHIAPKRVKLWAQLLQESCHDYRPSSEARISE